MRNGKPLTCFKIESVHTPSAAYTIGEWCDELRGKVSIIRPQPDGSYAVGLAGDDRFIVLFPMAVAAIVVAEVDPPSEGPENEENEENHNV